MLPQILAYDLSKDNVVPPLKYQAVKRIGGGGVEAKLGAFLTSTTVRFEWSVLVLHFECNYWSVVRLSFYRWKGTVNKTAWSDQINPGDRRIEEIVTCWFNFEAILNILFNNNNKPCGYIAENAMGSYRTSRRHKNTNLQQLYFAVQNYLLHTYKSFSKFISTYLRNIME